jgi:LmbE family N-acetylglucosaminyl deacetylase
MGEDAVGRPVIFVTPHPDDEVLGFSVQLYRHVAAGREVHVLALTNGSATRVVAELNGEVATPQWWRVRHNPTAEGYTPLTPEQVGTARLAEQRQACACVRVGADRIHHAGLQDGQVTAGQAKAAILALADQLGPDPGLWAPSFVVDNHPDHLAAGQAVKALGQQQPDRFWDRRYTVHRNYWSDPRLAQVGGGTIATPASTIERDRTINAARCYGAWAPRVGSYAIGQHSTPSLFAFALTNPKVMVHRDT